MTNTLNSLWSCEDPRVFRTSPLPDTSFPGYCKSINNRSTDDCSKSTLDDAMATVLVISDPNEVNENFSIFIKQILDNVYEDDQTYQTISNYSLKLLTSNMFIKNYQFCIGKILTLLDAFSNPCESSDERVIYQSECLKEFLCITLLLLLKLKNSKNELELIDKDLLYDSLIKFKFVPTMGKFISTHIVSNRSFVLLKFSCDIFFEFLYYREVFDDDDFDDLVNSKLVSTIISHLLTAKINHSYDVDGDTYEDEDKLVAYEQFKLLLLINEQFLMKSYTSKIPNRVFEVLMLDDNGLSNNNRMVTFINLLIYHLNREESQIIKILILKFLNSIFTNKETNNLVYLNDLKILVDIFIRELNDLDYDVDNDTRILVIDYLRVMYPLLSNTQLAQSMDYKSDQILEVLRSLVLASQNSDANDNIKQQENVIVKLATRCMGITWLKPKRDFRPSPPLVETSTDLSDISDIGAAFTRIASVRTSNRADYHRHTTIHNNKPETIAESRAANNHNLFLDNFETLKIKSQTLNTKWGDLNDGVKSPTDCNILDLPSEYMNSKPLPNLPVPEKRRGQMYAQENSSASSINSVSLLVKKALKKKAPPPPPPSSRGETPIYSSSNLNGNTPPPPPPPRRRRG